MPLPHFVIKTVIPQNLDSMKILTVYFFQNYQEGRGTIDNRLCYSHETILTILNF